MESNKHKQFFVELKSKNYDKCLDYLSKMKINSQEDLLDIFDMKYELYLKKEERLIASYCLNEKLIHSNKKSPFIESDLLKLIKLTVDTESSIDIVETVKMYDYINDSNFELRFYYLWVSIQKENYENAIIQLKELLKEMNLDLTLRHNILVLLAYCFFKVNREIESRLAFFQADNLKIEKSESVVSEYYQFLHAQVIYPSDQNKAIAVLKNLLKEEINDRNIDVLNETNQLLTKIYKSNKNYENCYIQLESFERKISKFRNNSMKIKFSQFSKIKELQSEFADKIKQLYKNKIEETKRQIIEYSKINLEYNRDDYIFSSEKMTRIFMLVDLIHQNRDLPVLIEGETGTGKEIIAKAIHYGNNDKLRPFIKINCAAINSNLFESELFGYDKGAFTGASATGKIGKFELAQNGTLFLDEIGELTMAQQAKLLRVIQEKEIYRVGSNKNIKLDVRIICATNKNLKAEIQKGNFRNDLYFRLNTGEINLPPLRERKGEIIPLTELYLNKISKVRNKNFKSISEKAATKLQEYMWPGNVRELINVIERSVLLYDDTILKSEYLNLVGTKTNFEPDEITIKLKLEEDEDNLKRLMQQSVKQVLTQLDNNKAKTVRFFKTYRSKITRILNKEF